MEAVLSFDVPGDYTLVSLLNHLRGKISQVVCKEQSQQQKEALSCPSQLSDRAQHSSTGRHVVIRDAEEPSGISTGYTWICSSLCTCLCSKVTVVYVCSQKCTVLNFVSC